MSERLSHGFWLVVLLAIVAAMVGTLGCEAEPPVCHWAKPGLYRIDATLIIGSSECFPRQSFIADHDTWGIQTYEREDCATIRTSDPGVCGSSAKTTCEDGFYIEYVLSYPNQVPTGTIQVGYGTESYCKYHVLYTPVQ